MQYGRPLGPKVFKRKVKLDFGNIRNLTMSASTTVNEIVVFETLYLFVKSVDAL